MIAIIAFIVLLTYGQRRVTIRRGKMQVGRRTAPAHTSYLPLRINTAGVIPVIFASSIMMFPTTILQLLGGVMPEGMADIFQSFAGWFVPGNPVYLVFEFSMILFFCYFYTAITFNPKDIAENLQKQGVAPNTLDELLPRARGLPVEIDEDLAIDVDEPDPEVHALDAGHLDAFR